ncbi:MAG TPA: ABC transporter substrate-binding protein [Methylomirabilota bacterium]|nr:ABC transporter substrate-binding protein [Methylomirabilota bacterium]
MSNDEATARIDATERVDAFRRGMESFGYRDGSDIRLVFRYIEGGADRGAALTDELIRDGAAVIVTGNPGGVEGAMRASKTVPIVMAGVGNDPVTLGYVASLARPGGNVTGLSFQAPTLQGRRLQLLKDVLPAGTRLGVLHDGTLPASANVGLQNAAAALGVHLEIETVEVVDQIEAAVAALRSRGVTGFHVNIGSRLGNYMPRIGKAATDQRMASTFGVLEGARAGLLALGPDQVDLYRRAAAYVDKILKGASPSDLPVEQPEKIGLWINLRTAQAIGLTIPDAILAQATDVIR